MDERPNGRENLHVLPLLQALKKSSKDLQTVCSVLFNFNDSKPAIEAILKLATGAETALSSSKPSLLRLSRSLDDLKAQSEKLEKLRGRNVVALLYRQIAKLQISRIARSIEAEIESFADRTAVENLLSALATTSDDDREKVEALSEFRNRLARGFDGEFQEVVLRGRVFSALEHVLGGEAERVRDEAAVAVLALVEFNKDVFVGAVLMGPTTRALISAGSVTAVRVLWSLVGKVKGVLVDHMECGGEMAGIVRLCGAGDVRVGMAAAEVAMEIAFFGSREAVEAMVVGEGLVKRLMALQRAMEEEEEEAVVGGGGGNNWVARLAVQVEVGEGLGRRDKRELRSEILRLVGVYSVSEAESATILADLFWASSTSISL